MSPSLLQICQVDNEDLKKFATDVDYVQTLTDEITQIFYLKSVDPAFFESTFKEVKHVSAAMVLTSLWRDSTGALFSKH